MLAALFIKAAVPDSHGLEHARIVMEHGRRTLDSVEVDTTQNAARPNAVQSAAVLLACFLHDADDHKYFPAEGLVNAEQLLQEALARESSSMSADDGAELRRLTLRMIELVSASANANSVPVAAEAAPWLLWPRWCDRLESIGAVGVVRCWQYTLEKAQPLHRPGLSPRPLSEAQLWELVRDEQLLAYQASGGRSLSMMDHFYDKLLHLPGGLLKRPELVRAPYLLVEAAARVAPLLEVCVAYGQSGGEVPRHLFEEMARQVDAEQCRPTPCSA